MGNVNPLTGTITDNLNAAWNYTVANCTRFVAGALSWIPAGLGNASEWFANAQAKGLPTAPANATPVPGSVAVWNTGQFGHVAEVIGAIPGGFRVAEENFTGGLGQTDVRDVTGSALRGLEGFILPPGGVPVLGGLAQGAQSVLSAPQAIAELPASIGHGLANAGGALVQNAGIAVRNQLVPLIVALVVAIVLFGGDESK
jgi:CHAP domain